MLQYLLFPENLLLIKIQDGMRSMCRGLREGLRENILIFSFCAYSRVKNNSRMIFIYLNIFIPYISPDILISKDLKNSRNTT